jgi:uncharacterized membrane protein
VKDSKGKKLKRIKMKVEQNSSKYTRSKLNSAKINRSFEYFSRLFFLVPVLIFSILWIHIMILELDSFNIDIFDYGVVYNLAWKEAFGIPALPSTVAYLPYFLPTKLISFVLVPYIRLFPNIYDLLIMQVIVIALPSIILYFLSMKLTNKITVSLAVEILWLLYYPNNALIYYGFHYQTIFPLFYILGFSLFYLRKFKLSLLSLFFASITSLLAPLILFFTIPTFFIVRKKMKNHYQEVKSRAFYFLYAGIFAVSLFVLLLNFHYGGINIFKGEAIPTTSSASELPIYTVLWNKFLQVSGYQGFLYILFMTFPLVFSIFIEYEFIFASIPAIAYYLVGYSGGYLRYFYPMQYSVLISPVVFLSFIFLIGRIHNEKVNSLTRRWDIFIRTIKKAKLSRKKIISILITITLIANTGLFAVYSPIGPLNQFLKDYPNLNAPSNGGYGLYKNLNVTTYDKNLLKMEALVPLNATVLSQFNMPQFSNRYYFTYPGQYNPNQPIDYAINDPQNYYRFTTSTDDTGPDFYNYNMLQLSNMFLQNSTYGVYAQSEGAILFKHGYSGNPVYFVPANASIKVRTSSSDTLTSEAPLLSPGTYNVTAFLDNSSNSTLYMNKMDIGTFNGKAISTTLMIPFYENVIFSLSGKHNAGIVYLRQIAPAITIGLNKPQLHPSYFHTFKANYSYFSPIVVNSVNLNTKSFSYFYMINLTTYEDGLKTPKDIRNDSQVFSLGGVSVWNQIENDGKFEFGFRNQNYHISQYIQPYIIKPGNWTYVEATYRDGYINIFVNGFNFFSAQIFPYGSSVGNISNLMIGGAHPFLNGDKTYPNSNPLNASIANFVILNGTMTLSEIQNPQLILQNLSNDRSIVYSNWINIVE